MRFEDDLTLHLWRRHVAPSWVVETRGWKCEVRVLGSEPAKPPVRAGDRFRGGEKRPAPWPWGFTAEHTPLRFVRRGRL